MPLSRQPDQEAYHHRMALCPGWVAGGANAASTLRTRSQISPLRIT